MTFTPVVFGSGLTAWSLLKSTLARQKSNHAQTHLIQSDVSRFRDRFDRLRSAEDIVDDPSTMRVVLGAYGLSDDNANRFFIRKIMNDGATNPSALANKLSDRRYKALAKDFDYSGELPRSAPRKSAEAIIRLYKDSMFEVEIGKIDNDLRLALSFQRQLSGIADGASQNTTGWYQVLGTPPVRQVLETALGLPKEFSSLDIDEQHSRIIEKTEKVFGTSDLEQLSRDAEAEAIIRRFLLLRQTEGSTTYNGYSTALALLTSSQRA